MSKEHCYSEYDQYTFDERYAKKYKFKMNPLLVHRTSTYNKHEEINEPLLVNQTSELYDNIRYSDEPDRDIVFNDVYTASRNVINDQDIERLFPLTIISIIIQTS